MPDDAQVDPSETIAALRRELETSAAKRDEALAQEAAISEVLQIINNSPSDLTRVFDVMLEKAMRLCEAAFGVLLTYNGEAFHAVAERGIPAAFSDFLRQPLRPAPGNSTFRMVGGETIVQIADLLGDEATRHGDPARRAVIEMGGARTQLIGRAAQRE
jgi:hypothetical protein